MSFWSSFPFFRYLIWLIAGIIAGFIFLHAFSASLFIIIFLAVLYILLYVFRHYIPSFHFWQGVVAAGMLFLFGYGNVQKHNSLMAAGEEQLEENAFYLMEVRNDAVLTPKTVKLQAKLLAVNREGVWREEEGATLLYIRQEGLEELPRFGDRLMVQAALKPIPAPLNPNEFNYKEYMASQGICCQAFVTAGSVRKVSSGGGSGLRGMAMDIRRWATSQVEAYVEGRREAAIVNALVLGYRETLDDEVMQAYATAGAMHILAVSGLHVGLIYLFLKLLFRPWRRNALAAYGGLACTILLLWSYALVTGLSPSVIRAAFMFSLLDIALLLKRKTGIYNTLAVAAFFMLCYNPMMLKMVGFQLSFLALFGIVYLQPRLAEWYGGENRIIQKLWQLTAVSMAAQLATFPLGLYYFGQFPTYFFMSNLLMVPAASFILGLGLLVLLAGLIWPPFAEVLGWLLDWLVYWANSVVFFTDSLPYSRLTGHISQLQLLLLCGFILSLLAFLHNRKFTLAVIFSCIGFALLGSFVWEEMALRRQKKLIVYHLPGYSGLQLLDGKKEYLLTDEALPATLMNFHIQPNRAGMGFGDVGDKQEAAPEPALINQQAYTLIVWQGLKMVQLKEALPMPCHLKEPVAVDYVLITHNSVQNLGELLCYFKPRMLLIDGSNHYYQQKRLKEQAEALNFPYHVTTEAGAFELDL